jgi:hypothetical protein
VTNAPLTERDKNWQGYCKYAIGLHRHPDDLADFRADLQSGRRPDVTEPVMMTAALALVSGMADAGVRRWDFLPAPGADDLRDPAAWATQRLAEQRAAQDSAERIRRGQHQLARALGGPRSTASGTINPVHLQQPKRSLEEMGQRLECVIAKHAKRGEFRREDLDHRSKHYISDRDGGISNKQLVLMANLIVGRQEKRPYDQNWKIVVDWLRDRRAKQQPVQPDEQVGATQ